MPGCRCRSAECGVGACLSQSNFFTQLADASLHLIAEITDTVADVGQPVIQLAELLAIEDLLLTCRGGILAVLAGAVAPEASVAAHKDEQEEDDDPPRIALAPAVVIVATGHGSDIAQRHVIHS